MSLNVDILSDFEVSPELKDALAALMASAIENVPDAPRGDWSMSIRLTTDAEIARFHQKYFSDYSPTDAISFPYGDDPAASSGYLGDVIISVDTARLNAQEAGHSEARELAFLALHGLLHLCGHDDDTAERRAVMLERQECLLTRFEASVDAPW
jgi:probable rRNA maturation factor